MTVIELWVSEAFSFDAREDLKYKTLKKKMHIEGFIARKYSGHVEHRVPMYS